MKTRIDPRAKELSTRAYNALSKLERPKFMRWSPHNADIYENLNLLQYFSVRDLSTTMGVGKKALMELLKFCKRHHIHITDYCMMCGSKVSFKDVVCIDRISDDKYTVSRKKEYFDSIMDSLQVS